MPPCSLCHGPRAVSKNILAEMAEARKYVLGLYVVPQCKLNGIGVEIVLPLQVRFIVFSHVMVHYGDRNNKRNVTLLVCLYNLEHLGLFIGCQVFLEIAKAVQENVRVLLAGGLKPRCCHEKPRIRGVEFVRRVCLTNSTPLMRGFSWQQRGFKPPARSTRTFSCTALAISRNT